MKAIVCTKSGPPEVLQLKDFNKPIPADHEVLVKVHAATVTQGDVMLRKLHPLLVLPMRLFGVRRKRIPGHEFAGIIEEVGKKVKRFKAGDQVYGTTTGLAVGANAEYVCLPEAWKSGVIAPKPANLSYEEAAAVPVGGMTALYLLKKGNIQPGDRVLVYGASGSVGTYALQLTRHHFNAEVTAVCSTANIDLVKSLGAGHVIDYTQEDLSQSSQVYDHIFDAVGKFPSALRKPLLKEESSYLSVSTPTREETGNLETLTRLIEAGVIKPVIDRRYPLEQIVEAHKYVETGHKKGNVVITLPA